MSLCTRFCLWFCFPKKTHPRCPEDTTKLLKETTVLSTGQIQHLYERFCLLAECKGDDMPKPLRKRHFYSIGHLQANPLFPIIVASMFGDKKSLSFFDFATYLSTFQANSLRTKREQIVSTAKRKKQLIFNMYDVDKDGCISQRDMIKIIHKLFADHVQSREEILNLVDVLLVEMDKSHTNQILFEDFCTSLDVFDMEEKLVTFIPEA